MVTYLSHCMTFFENGQYGQSYKCAYNTGVCFICISVWDITNVIIQASEQLDAWIGGFESILTKMNVSNFNWFLHTMLFMHTQYIIEKQRKMGIVSVEEKDDDYEEVSTDMED